MLNIDFLENSGFFQIKTLNEGEVLFDEGDLDNNLYIIKKGELSIEKYIDNNKKETKVLARLLDGEIFGEGALGDNLPKQVKIIAKTQTTILSIEAKNSFEKFLLKHTKGGVDLLSSIIYISNKRLLEANFLITSSYKINKHISEINDFNNINLFSILDEFSKTIVSDYIIYLEKNPVIDNIVTIKYDSRKKGKMQQIVIDIKENNLDLQDILDEGIELSNYNLIEKLKNKNEVIGYIIIGNKAKNFDEAQKKSISIISVSIAGFIKQKQYFEELKNKEYIQ